MSELLEKYAEYIKKLEEIKPGFIKKEEEKVYAEKPGFCCRFCKHPKIRELYQLQLRSADEPATLFFECEKCRREFPASEA